MFISCMQGFIQAPFFWGGGSPKLRKSPPPQEFSAKYVATSRIQ